MRFISMKEVKYMLSLSATEIRRRIEADTFPEPRKLGNGPRGRIGFVDKEIRDYMISLGYPPDTNDDQ